MSRPVSVAVHLHDRRQLLQCWARLAVMAGSGALPGSGRAQTPPQGSGQARSPDDPHGLVAILSRTGHTRQAALGIAAAVGADLFEIMPATPYPQGYQETVDLNVRQRAMGVFPDSQRPIPQLKRY